MPRQLDKNNITRLSSGNVFVIGDIILDEFVTGSPERISREAPVLILEHISSNFALGGASNAAHNISELGANCILAGVTGDDMYSKALENECFKLNITPALVIDEKRPTTVKTRLMSIAHKHPTSQVQFKQQILRLDRLSRNKISQAIEKELIKKFNNFINKTNTVLISDYDLGVCSNTLTKYIIKTTKKEKKKAIVDASRNFKRFKGCYLITPNQPDTEEAVGFEIKDKTTLIKAAKKLLNISGAENILITMGANGMALFNTTSPEKPFILPAFNVSEVFDVTGAGDTVSGIIACAVSVNLPIEIACSIANIGASVVVKKYGTAVTNIDELNKYFQLTSGINKNIFNGVKNGKRKSRIKVK